jgi:uncharacterized membrane protein YphA (DoxX/SURF4 family)
MEFKLLDLEKYDFSAILAFIIGPFLATAGVLKLVLGRWWDSAPSTSAPQPSGRRLPKAVFDFTSAIEVLFGVTLVYPQLRTFSAVMLLGMIAFLEVENRRRGAKSLGWAFRIPALIVTGALVGIVILEGGTWLPSLQFWSVKFGEEARRWAGLEEREVDLDF